MRAPRPNKRGELLDAAVRLVANGGAEAVTIRAIARQAGVTDGAVYRHYRSKEDLCAHAFAEIEGEMLREKQELLASDLTVRQRLHEWVRISYAYFDRRPEAFSYVLLTQPAGPGQRNGGPGRQGRLFMRLIADAIEAGQARPTSPEMAYVLFTGLMLNVPRAIAGKVLDGPAVAYVDEVAEAIGRVLLTAP